MDGYVADLRNWLAGILNWHQDCRRYGAADLARRAHGFVPDRTPGTALPWRGEPARALSRARWPRGTPAPATL